VSTHTAQGPRPAGAHHRTAEARDAVTGLYQVHAVGLIRLGVVMLGDRGAAEDVVQEAFCGLFRHWGRLSDPAKAVPYLRSAVLNGCRSALRHRRRRHDRPAEAGQAWDAAESAEASALLGEEHREVLAALRRLPARQREALVLRFYLELAEPEIATIMGVSQGTVKSTTSRGLTALGRLIKEPR
jgi:RNA polymerase sigma-70 factor (sigma-E family)